MGSASAEDTCQETIEFEYSDSDEYLSELAELYSYSEEPELAENYRCFSRLFAQRRRLAGRWLDTDDQERGAFIEQLLCSLDECSGESRLTSVRALLYVAQGVWAECQLEEDQVKWTVHNVHLLLSRGAFAAVCHLLAMEAEAAAAAETSSSALAASYGRKPAVSLADSVELRAVHNLLYTMLETARCFPHGEHGECWVRVRAQLRQDLLEPTVGEDTLPVLLLGMVTKFCSGYCSHYPMKKVLLLLWKSALFALGPLEELHQRRNTERASRGLTPVPEETVRVCQRMRACSPPPSAADLIDHQMPRRRSSRKAAAAAAAAAASATAGTTDATDIGGDVDSVAAAASAALESAAFTTASAVSASSSGQGGAAPQRLLLWEPKVSQRELQVYLQQVRQKFLGYQAAAASAQDTESLAGLPRPIHECVRVLRSRLYVSLAELHIQREEEIVRYPMTKGRAERPQDTPAELLYRSLLPCIPQYMIALLKVLLAAAPTSKSKSEAINLVAEVLPEEMPTSMAQSLKLGTDVNRHKEVIVKAISGLLLLLLKHFKFNHVYQFEYMAQHLVFANCIPLILKFFNQNIVSYVQTRNSIPRLDFPNCLFRLEGTELSADLLDSPTDHPHAGDTYSWRNMFACVSLARVLNKLTKGKHSRTMMLVVFKSAPILKRALRVRHPVLQVYLLKLIKAQTKYLGRQWRKINMSLMSCIYEKVRHRLTDDWAFANDLEARPWDFQSEECGLRNSVDRFNQRRYQSGAPSFPEGFQPLDNNLSSVLSRDQPLTAEFQRGYEQWLEQEVFATPINWDLVLQKIAS